MTDGEVNDMPEATLGSGAGGGAWSVRADAEVPAAPDSPLASLRERRKARRAKLNLDLRVPGYDPEIYIRFQPADLSRLAAELKKAELSKERDAVALANAALLIEACAGLFQVTQAGTEVSIDPADPTPDPAKWLRFGPELGAMLADEGETLNRASDVVRALYDNDMAMAAAATRLIEWSQSMDQELDRENSGN